MKPIFAHQNYSQWPSAPAKKATPVKKVKRSSLSAKEKRSIDNLIVYFIGVRHGKV